MIDEPVGADALRSQIEGLSLEELLNPNVTSVSKKTERFFDTAAAVFVINGDDLRRSGVRSIPEALRMAPGLQVGQLDGGKWAISSRGFNDRFADKLLVMIDGRVIFSPSFSGVMWDVQNYLMEDIDRIEVVRGPGGTLWGANAVNGVINIITKGADKTRGTFFHGGFGTEQERFGGFRHGQALGENSYLRFYGDFFERDGTVQHGDSYDNLQFGFQYLWEDVDQRLTFQGDYYQGNVSQVNNLVSYTPLPGTTPPSYLFPSREEFHVDGANLLLRYKRSLDVDSDLQLQLYWDYTNREEVIFDGYRHTVDLDFNHSLPLGESHSLIWGLGYRYMPDEFRNPDTSLIRWDPAQTNHQLFSGFVQGEFSLIEDTAKLIVGTKVEHNDYSGWEVQPNVRLLIKPTDNQTVWFAASRAVAVPLRNFEAIREVLIRAEPTQVPVDLDMDSIPDANLPLFVRANGVDSAGDIIDPQELWGFEAGYRIQPVPELTLDFTAFYNLYDRLVSGSPGIPYPVNDPAPHLVLPIFSENFGEATTYGGEISVRWAVTDWWRLAAYYSYLDVDMHGVENAIFTEGIDSKHQFSIQTSWDLPGDVEFDLWLRYVDELPSFNIDSYVDLDARIGWHVNENFELSLVGQNLLDSSRQEFSRNSSTNFIRPSEIERGAYLEARLRF